MSLIFGARSIVGGITASCRSKIMLSSNLRSFQTLSSSSLADTNSNSGSSSNNGNYTTNSIYAPLYYNNNNNSIQLSHFSTTNKNELKQQQFRNGKPTLEYAKTLPSTFASMTNEQVLQFAEIGLVPEACRECIVRDVMVVDQIDYDEVCMEIDWECIWLLMSLLYSTSHNPPILIIHDAYNEGNESV